MAFTFGGKSNNNPFGGGSSANNPFGGGSTNTASTGFGGNSGFGGGSFNTTNNSGFGAASNTTPAFGANTAGFGAGNNSNAFGNNNRATSAFGGGNTTNTSAFGSNNNTGFGNTNNTTPAFGSNTATSAFGGNTGSAFGGSANSAFGGGNTAGFGNTSNTSAFGNNTNTSGFGNTANTSGFGGTQNSSGFGTTSGFGNTANTGSAFGNTANTGSAFGNTANTGSAFGSATKPTTGGFGNTNASPFGGASATPFGGASNTTSSFGFGGGNNNAMGNRVGTGNPPYRITKDTDYAAAGAKLVALPAMQEYASKSMEEWRYEDYLKKSDPAAATALGAAQPNTTNAFGAGNSNTMNNSGGFGNTNAFGGASTTNNTIGNSMFGNTTTTTQPAMGFGASTSNTFGGSPSTFGSTTTQPSANTGFSFGQSNTSGFGNTNTGFGSTPTTTTNNAFGATTSSGFGTTTPSTGAFGAPATNTFGSTTNTGFGTPAPTTASTSTFGATNAQSNTGFQSNTFGAAATPSSNAFSFGGANSSATKPATGGFGFSSAAPTTSKPFGSTSTSLFGATTPSTTSTFGAAPAAGGFGFNTSTAPKSSAGSLFSSTGGFGTASGGAAPTSLFSNSTSGGFGASTTNTFGTPSAAGGLFSSTPAPAASGSLFGNTPSTFNSTSNPGMSSFGAFGSPSTATNQPNASLVAAPNVNAYGSGTVGAGLVAQQVQAALAIPLANDTSKNTVGVGLSRSAATLTPTKCRPLSSYRYKPSTTVGGVLSRISSNSSKSILNNTVKQQIMSPDVFRAKQTKSLQIDQSTELVPFNVPTANVSKDDSQEEELDDNTIQLHFMESGKKINQRYTLTSTIKDIKNTIFTTLSDSIPGSYRNANDFIIIHRGKSLVDDDLISKFAKNGEQTFDVCIADHDAGVSKSSKKVSSMALVPAKKNLNTNRLASYDEVYGRPNGTIDIAAETEASVPTLTDASYYTNPDILTLSKMTNDELRQVEEFTVGVHGLGSVMWYGVTDVRNLDINNIVEFQPRSISVYHDESTKPEVGTELNKPAWVQLCNVFPKKNNRNYYEKVKRKTKEIGATFIDYDESKGLWTFRTEHFSRYGLDDDSDDEEDDTSMVSQQELALVNGKQESNRLIPQLPYQLGLNAGRLQALRASFMGINVSTNTKNELSIARTMGESVEKKVERSNEVPQIPMHSTADDTPQPKFILQEPIVFRAVPVSASSYQPLGIDSHTNDLPSEQISDTYRMYRDAFGNDKTTIDHSLFMGRSFRCGWGPNGQLVHSGTLFNGKLKPVENKFRVYVEHPLKVSHSAQSKAMLSVNLKYAAANKLADANENDSSCFSLPPGDTSELVSCMHEYVRSTTGSYRHAFELANALWGQEFIASGSPNTRSSAAIAPICDNGSLPDNSSNFYKFEMRREGISKWFQNTIPTIIGSKQANFSPSNHVAGLDRILELLSLRDIENASEVAFDIGDAALATLLSQALVYEGSDFRCLVQHQLDMWASIPGYDSHVDPMLKRIYLILCGNVVEAISDRKLHWMVSLGMLYWYTNGPGQRLVHAVDQYESCFRNSQLAYPSPSYLQDMSISRDAPFDILYGLLKMYVDPAHPLHVALDASSCNGISFDVELSWHLNCILSQFQFELDDQQQSNLEQSFIAQLEYNGSWEWAVYVALTIASETQRFLTVKAILLRHCETFNKDMERKRFLREDIGVPERLLQEVMAIRAFYDREQKNEIAHWLAARKWEEAHMAIILRLAPLCIFSGDNDVLQQFLLHVENGMAEDSYIVANWENYGGLILEYLQLTQTVDFVSQNSLDDVMNRVAQMCSKFRDWKSMNGSWMRSEEDAALEQICVSSMLAQSVKLLDNVERAIVEKSDLEANQEFPSELTVDRILSIGSYCRRDLFGEDIHGSMLNSLCSTFVSWNNSK